MIDRPRASGVLLHVTSLPGPLHSGDFGPDAYAFVDFLAAAKQRYWQVLPLVPAATGDSPYTSLSAFAGNPWLVSPTQLAAEGWLEPARLQEAVETTACHGAVAGRAARLQLLRSAAASFHRNAAPSQREDYERFIDSNRDWLDDYCLFAAIGESTGTYEWNRWPAPLRARDPAALREIRGELAEELVFLQTTQYFFDRQWQALRRYAADRGVQIFGDIPIFVAYESADVWQHQRLFFLDMDGRRTVVAGVPPDYFSADGQLWGNPLYRWSEMAKDGFSWWRDRLRHSLGLFDLIRLDHFRGFEAYWEVAADAKTAVGGHWIPGPGLELFQSLHQELGDLPLVAEDLGLITPEVLALRDVCGFPGMRVFQFGFDDDYLGQYHRPHSYPDNCVAYTGTHDNDTSLGWYQANADTEVGHRVRVYLSSDGHDIAWKMLEAVARSAARTVIMPMQDLLGLDSSARMNIPGVGSGNWSWRLREGQATPALASRLAALTQRTGRSDR
jgi:4-alpha-glucanotransferase